MPSWDKCCAIGVLFFAAGLLCAHAQNVTDSVQAGVTNVTVDGAAQSAAVQSQVHAYVNQDINMGLADSSNSANRNAAPVNLFAPVKNESGAALRGDSGAFSSSTLKQADEARNLFMNRASGTLGSGLQAVHLSILQSSSASNVVESTGIRTMPGLAGETIVNSAQERSLRSTAAPSISPGEFPDSTRERVWPSPSTDANQSLFSFNPSVTVFQPDFAQSVQLHLYYGNSMRGVNRIGTGSRAAFRLGYKGLSNMPTGLLPGLTPDQTLTSPLQNGLSGASPTSLGLADPLASNPQQ